MPHYFADAPTTGLQTAWTVFADRNRAEEGQRVRAGAGTPARTGLFVAARLALRFQSALITGDRTRRPVDGQPWGGDTPVGNQAQDQKSFDRR